MVSMSSSLLRKVRYSATALLHSLSSSAASLRLSARWSWLSLPRTWPGPGLGVAGPSSRWNSATTSSQLCCSPLGHRTQELAQADELAGGELQGGGGAGPEGERVLVVGVRVRTVCVCCGWQLRVISTTII